MASFPPVLLAGAFFLIFGAIIYLVFRSARRHQEEMNRQIRSLGYKALGSPPPGLQTRVEELYQSPGEGQLVLENIYHRQELERDMYIFDVSDPRDGDSEAGREVFGVISSQLALPNFSLSALPEFDRNSPLGGLLDKMLDKVVSLAEKRFALRRVEFPDRPEFEENFLVFGRDPDAVREFLDRVPLSSLRNHTAPVQISGSGDFLMVDFKVSGDNPETARNILSQYQQFSEISKLFSR